MGLPVARIGDKGIGIDCVGSKCCPHCFSLTIITGAMTVQAENSPVAQIGGKASTTSPHTPIGTIIQGSPSVIAENKPASRVGDKVQASGGTGTITTGATRTIIE